MIKSVFLCHRKSGRPFTITVEGNVGSGKSTLLGTQYITTIDVFESRLCLNLSWSLKEGWRGAEESNTGCLFVRNRPFLAQK